jgi:hypothetical protein
MRQQSITSDDETDGIQQQMFPANVLRYQWMTDLVTIP